MKKVKNKKNSKLALLTLAAVIPMATTGAISTAVEILPAHAATSSTTYQKSYVEQVTLSNSNFNSTSSSTLLTSPTGWAKQVSDNNTTAGVINTGSSFQRYMTSSFYLSKNPGTSGADSQVLMINSRTKKSGDYSAAKQGFRSNSVTLDANSYYSFKVVFKSAANYERITTYEQAGSTGDEEHVELTKNAFASKPFKVDEDGNVLDEYISFTLSTGSSFYLLKTLDKTNPTVISSTMEDESDLKDINIFYEDDNFVGFMYNGQPVYVNKTDITDPTKEDGKVDIKNGANAYLCKNITFEPSSSDNVHGVYKVAPKTAYYNAKTTSNPLNTDSRGSIYLNGLKDKDGKTVKAEFTGVTSKDWVTFNFFVATGDQSQTVNLELWLGGKSSVSSGVVFFDNVRVSKYSENAFWKTYNDDFDKSYDITYSNAPTTHQNCTQFCDFRTSKELSAKDLSLTDTTTEFDFNFEKGSASGGLEFWTKEHGSAGNAGVFDIQAAPTFKNITGYDFVGSDLSYDVELEQTDEDTPRLKVKTSTENGRVLALWTDNNSVKVLSQDIKIERQKIYKISARYKVSEITSGNAYMFIKESDALVKDLVDDEAYTLASEATSSALSTSTSDNFLNNYATAEFYVKGNALVDSAINIGLGLGNSSESSTGCIVFDNVKVETATSAEYENATNKVQLGTAAGSSTLANGEFDNVTTTGEEHGLYAPQNWTITNGSGNLFNGVVNTASEYYKQYRAKFDDYKAETKCPDSQNPYYWTTYQNPGNSFGDENPENVLVLGNVSKTWQKLRSESFDISANSAYNGASDPIHKLSFMFKTGTQGSFNITLFEESGMKLFEKKDISSANWKEDEVYFKSFPGASKVYVEIDFGTQSEGKTGVVYLDRFDVQSDVTLPSNPQNVVDMTNFGLNLDENFQKLGDQSTSTPFKGSVTSSDGNTVRGEIVKGFNFEKGSSLYYVEDAQDDDFFFMSVGGAGAYTIQSNFNIDLEAGTYYALTFKVKTHFNILNDETESEYGVTLGLTGFKYIANIVSDKEFKEYKIIFNSENATSTQLYMALICGEGTSGSAAIYAPVLSKSTEDEFNEAQTATNDEAYDVNESCVLASEADDSVPDEDETTDDSSDAENANQSFNWLLIPTLITALAIVIAVVGYFLRKVKIKKIQIKRKSSYDRKTSANVDLIKRKAAQARDEELNALETSKAKYEQELATLESTHKSKVVALREKDKGAVSKETDKEFKIFAKKRTVIAEKLEVLNKQIDETKSAEHLLSLERKIYAEQESQRRKMQKDSKKEAQKTANNSSDKK